MRHEVIEIAMCSAVLSVFIYYTLLLPALVTLPSARLGTCDDVCSPNWEE